MGWFGIGKEVKEAGAGIKDAGEAVTGVLAGIRTMITGDLPPDAIIKLKELEGKALEASQKIQTGQQEIETAAINKGGFNSFFLAGWRPMLGWIASLSIFIYYVPPIFLQTIFWFRASMASGVLVDFPHNFDIGEIMGLVASLLGMGVLRTIEKSSGTNTLH